jgi:hypothetical protein
MYLLHCIASHRTRQLSSKLNILLKIPAAVWIKINLLVEILFQEIAARFCLLHYEMLPVFVVGGGELSNIRITWLEWCQSLTTLRVSKFCRHIQVMYHAVILEGIFTLHQDLGKWSELNLIHDINKDSNPFIFMTVLRLFTWRMYGTYCGDLEGHFHLIILYTAEIKLLE